MLVARNFEMKPIDKSVAEAVGGGSAPAGGGVVSGKPEETDEGGSTGRREFLATGLAAAAGLSVAGCARPGLAAGDGGTEDQIRSGRSLRALWTRLFFDRTTRGT